MKKPKIIYINGRFLNQRLSGVQRFAREIVLALDAELQRSDAVDPSWRWVLLAPPSAPDDLELRSIVFRRAGLGSGNLWDQLSFAFAARDGFAVSLANNGSVLHGRSLTVLHDAMVFRTPGNFSPLYRIFHRGLDRLLAWRSHIGTVSEFSRSELADALGLEPKKIPVIPNGSEHLGRASPDFGVLDRLGVTTTPYFLCVGSLTPNKNLARAVEAFRPLAERGRRLVIVGAQNAAVFGDALGAFPSGVIFAGYLTDGEISALYQRAQALLFPSLYEGFGIPPLEAMVQGCPVLAADIPSVREICGDLAIYFDPLDVASIARALLRADEGEAPFKPPQAAMLDRCSRYSWSASARGLLAAIGALMREDDGGRACEAIHQARD